MSSLAGSIAAKRASIAARIGLPRPIRDMAEWIIDNGANFALTLTPDIRPGRSFDPELRLRPILRKVAKAIAHDVRGVPKRKLHDASVISQAVWMFGFYEAYDRSGGHYPHYHGVVSLRPGEDRELNRALMNRWGLGRDLIATRPLFRQAGCFPDFDLVALHDAAGWLSYSEKGYAAGGRITWTHADLLG